MRGAAVGEAGEGSNGGDNDGVWGQRDNEGRSISHCLLAGFLVINGDSGMKKKSFQIVGKFKEGDRHFS